MSKEINEPVKIQGYWNGEPIWRKLTPREKLLLSTEKEGEKKSLNFVADVIEKKHGQR
jgi:hypothetical protein